MKWMIVLLALISSSLVSALETGKSAPDFSLTGVGDKAETISLSQFKGKIVVLEWSNHGCPFVRKHYDSGNMQSLQKHYTSQGVVWLTIFSSAPGKQGHVDVSLAQQQKIENKSLANYSLLDPSGKVGKLYEAKTTPHMYIIDQSGTLVYQGAIDDTPDADTGSVKKAKNYIEAALKEILKGNPITIRNTKSYGCSIKY